MVDICILRYKNEMVKRHVVGYAEPLKWLKLRESVQPYLTGVLQDIQAGIITIKLI